MRHAARALFVAAVTAACDHPATKPPRPPSRDAATPVPPLPAPPPQRAPRGVTQLGLFATIPTPRSVALRATGTTLLLGGDVIRAYPLGARAPSATITGEDAAVSQFRGSFFAAKGLVIGLSSTSEVAALDAITGAPRWRWHHEDPSPAELDSLTPVGDAMALLLARPPTAPDTALRGQLVVLSSARGEPRWSHDFERLPVSLASDGARLFVLEPSGRLTALDARDGAEAWHVDSDTAATRDDLVVSDGDALAITSPTRPMRVLRTRDGALSHTVELPGRAYARHPAAAGGGIVVVPVSTVTGGAPRRSLGAVRFVAVELSSGRIRWQSDEALGADRPSLSAPVIERDAVFTCGPDNVLRARDPSTGAERWQWGVGGCNTVTPLADRDAGALAIAVAWRDDAVAVFRRGESAPPALERATLSGVVTARSRPVAGCAVLAGDQSLRTDPRGRFTATVSARGIVRVSLPLEEFAQERLVELDGRATPYDVSFALPKHD